jgi:hypothetical protein
MVGVCLSVLQEFDSICSAMGHHRIGSTGGPDLVAQSGKVPGTMFEVLLRSSVIECLPQWEV